MSKNIVFSSFRDPSGFVYIKDKLLYRQINKIYRNNYDKFISSGLYEELLKKELIIPHREVPLKYAYSQTAYKIIRPEVVPFISYPYEWCFSQLKQAALNTLEIQKIALSYNMSLKDASCYNIQFYKGRPVLIDSLSFEKAEKGKPWIAYRQFCQHFLAPLALASFTDIRVLNLLRHYINGMPLDLTKRLLPLRSAFDINLAIHLHLQTISLKKLSLRRKLYWGTSLTKVQILPIILSLESAVKKLKIRKLDTNWSNYDTSHYSKTAFIYKKKAVGGWVKKIMPGSVWDLGANNGQFSMIASKYSKLVVSSDFDPVSIENNYLNVLKTKKTNILPLVIDLANPSPSQGFANREILSLKDRGPADLVMALALIHHLVISLNLGFDYIASYLNDICRYLIIELIPKSDPKVQEMIRYRDDIYERYNKFWFEKSFSKYFRIISKVKLPESERELYLMKKR